MYRKFTITFLKYMTLFLIVSIFLVILGLFIFGLNFASLFSTDNIKQLDTYELITEIDEKNGIYELSNSLKSLISEANYDAYIIDDNADILYPNTEGNIKELLLDHITTSMILPYKKNAHFALINTENESPLTINNKADIDSKTLIDSLYSHGYNQFDYYVDNNELHFIESQSHTSYTYINEFSDADITLFKLIGMLFLFIPFCIIILSLIISLLLARKLGRPLLFYVDWISQLSKGKLYKPSSKYDRNKYKKNFFELDQAVDSLNTQLLENNLYQNQIDYYRTKWLNQISHDLKSPLTSIYGYSKVMPYFPKDQEKYIALISDKAKYMEQLINSLNDTFKIETSQMELDKEAFSIVDAIEGIIKTVGYDKISFSSHLDDDLYYGNKLYIERMMINLIENSLDHNEINPDIHIELNDVQDGISLSYEDNGVGIDRNELDYLITSVGTTKERDEHHGIGFSVIQDAIIFHSGNLTVLPTNQGVKFLITLR